MIIFLNGSINAGKSTIERIVAERLGYDFVESDDIRGIVEVSDIDEAVPLVFDRGIALLNERAKGGISAVVAYPLGKYNYTRLVNELIDHIAVITLSPRIEVALSDRGSRYLSEKERARIKHHYSINIPNPDFRTTLDNSDMSIEETASRVVDVVAKLEQ